MINLTLHPWIPVIGQDGIPKSISLQELFRDWQGLRCIYAKDPIITYSLQRFVIAVLHAAYRGPTDERHWRTIVQDDGQQAIQYLERHQEAFQLDTFLQDLDLPETQACPAYVLYHYQPENTPTLFCHAHRWQSFRFSDGEVAQLLIRLQTIDLGCARSSYPGYTVSRTTKETPNLNKINVMVKGINLKETLLLNLYRYSGNPVDRPGWETDAYRGEPKSVVLTGYLSYLTYGWRRLRWVAPDRIVITLGSYLPADTVMPDPFIAYRDISKKQAEPDWKPVRMNLDRAVWRNADALLINGGNTMRPAILDWVAQLAEAGYIRSPLAIEIFGLAPKNNGAYGGWLNQQFAVSTKFLVDPSRWTLLQQAIEIVEQYGQLFRTGKGSAYGEIAAILKLGEAGSLKSLGGEQRFWGSLNAEFQALLTELLETPDAGSLEGWHKTIRKTAYRSFRQSLSSIHSFPARAAALNRFNMQAKKIYDGTDSNSAATGNGVSGEPQPQV